MDIQRMCDVNLIVSFLETILGKEVAEALIVKLGLFLTKDVSDHYGRTYIFSGSPGSGKTTMFNLLRILLGDNDIYEFIEDGNIEKLQSIIDNKIDNKIRFVATNTPFVDISSELKYGRETNVFTMTENIWVYSKYEKVVEAINRSYVYFAAYCGAKYTKQIKEGE